MNILIAPLTRDPLGALFFPNNSCMLCCLKHCFNNTFLIAGIENAVAMIGIVIRNSAMLSMMVLMLGIKPKNRGRGV